MREFVFTLEYDPGVDPVADVLATRSEASIRSPSCHVTPESLWRVDHATGSAAAIDALADAYFHPTYAADCLVKDDCGADCETQVLERAADSLVVYTYWDRTDVCTSVPHLALEHLGPGLLFETRREGRRYRWRIVLPDETPVGAFYDALVEEVGDCGGLEVLRLTDFEPGRDEEADSDRSMPDSQRRALREAVARGYYETPREIDLSELATVLEIPRSTLSYRLRRAEAHLATAFVDETALAAVADR